jgi:hypothetical protein
VVAIQLQGGAGGGKPVGGALLAVLAARGLADQPGKPAGAGGQQRVGVGAKAFQHRQVGHAELAGKRAGGQQLADQVLDAALVAGALLGEPVAGPHAAVQRRPLGAGQRQGVQPGRVDQRQPRQGVGVDAVGLGLPRQHPTQVVGPGRADPVDGVPAAGEEHRDRQPRRPGRLQHHLQTRGGRRALKGSLLCLGQARHGRDGFAAAHHAAVTSQHPDCVSADDPQVDPDQPSMVHRCLLAVVASCCSGGPQGRRSTTTVPRRRHPLPVPTTAPTHVLQPAPASTGQATSLIRGIRGRPRVAISSTRHGARAPSSEMYSTPPPEPAGMHMQPWDLGVDQAPESLT